MAAVVKAKTSSKRHSRHLQGRDLERACHKLLGREVLNLDYPGGRSRRSCRVRLKDGQSVIATQRARHRARIENRVMKALSIQEAPVPKLLANRSQLMLQEDIAGERLSIAVNQAIGEPSAVKRILAAGLTSLAAVQQAGSDGGLDTAVPILGTKRPWIVEFLRRPAVIGKYLNCPTPRPELEKLLDLLTVVNPRFIKWDARPGNAMVRPDGRVIWFDWEHCGARNRLDDVAWVLGDEFMPDMPAVEAQLIDEYIGEFADGVPAEQAKNYLYAYGVFHMTVRLGLILHYKRGGRPWWDFNTCISGDKIGVTEQTTVQLCRRAARWARQSPLTEVLGDWFETIEQTVITRPIP